MSAKPVLVGSDLSEPSQEAIRQAHDWASRRATKLVVCHVMPRRVGADLLLRQRLDDALGQSVLEARIAELVRKQAAEITQRAADEIEVVIDEGAPEVELLRVANERDASVIVVGSHGRAGLRDIFLGDVAESIVGDATRPVLVARPHARTGRILVGTDFSEPARSALEIAAEEARLRKARITLLTSIEQHMRVVLAMAEFGSTAQFVEREYQDERNKAEERLLELLRELRIDGDVIVTDENPASDLVKTAARIDAELVVVAAVSGSLLAKLRVGRVAEKVTRHAPCSVLVAREARK